VAGELGQRVDGDLLHVVVRIARKSTQARGIGEQRRSARSIYTYLPLAMGREPADPRAGLVGTNASERHQGVRRTVPRDGAVAATSRVARKSVNPRTEDRGEALVLRAFDRRQIGRT
jgi:hypothetical protein